jgi:hypothetical protein
VTSLISYLTARQAVEHQAFEKLIAVREMKGNQIEDYVGQITDQILTLSESRMVVDAMNDLRSGFDEIDDELALDPGELEQRDRRLRLYYQDQFLSRLVDAGTVHHGQPVRPGIQAPARCRRGREQLLGGAPPLPSADSELP